MKLKILMVKAMKTGIETINYGDDISCYEMRSSLCRERDKELMSCYRRIIAEMFSEKGEISRKEIVRRVIYRSRPKFYVSFFTAYKVVGKYLHSGELRIKNAETRAMWKDLAGKVVETRRANPEINYCDALAITLGTRRADRFYLSEEYVSKLLYHVVKENRKNGNNNFNKRG